MTETGRDVVERLPVLLLALSDARSHSERARSYDAAQRDLQALLAVVEAAQAVSDYPKQEIPFVLLSDLDTALQRLHSQASDDPEDRVLGPKEHYDLETQKWVPGQASDEGKASDG